MLKRLGYYIGFLVLLVIVTFKLGYIYLGTDKARGGFDLKTYNPNGFWIVVHRGKFAPFPENSMEGAKAVTDEGFAAELDVMQTEENAFIVIHDYSLKRTTGKKGDPREVSLNTLKRLEITYHQGGEPKGVFLPLLTDILNDLDDKAVVFLDLKNRFSEVSNEHYVDDLLEVLEPYKNKQIVLISADPFILEQLKLQNPDYPRGLIVTDFNKEPELTFYERYLLNHVLLNRFASPDILLVSKEKIDKDKLKDFKEKGYQVIVWVVDTCDEAKQYIDMGVDGLLTEKPLMVRDIQSGAMNCKEATDATS